MSKRAKKAVPARKSDGRDVFINVERLRSRGELRNSAILIKEAELSEEDFDSIMESWPELRSVYLSL